MTKMTYVQAIEVAINAVENEEVVEKLTALKGQLEKRSDRKHGMTKTQKENEVIMENIINGLAEMENPVTVTELINEVEELHDFTNQKISALLRKLVEAEKVIKTIEKKRAYFTLA